LIDASSHQIEVHACRCRPDLDRDQCLVANGQFALSEREPNGQSR
jgi:hypothetical protein